MTNLPHEAWHEVAYEKLMKLRFYRLNHPEKSEAEIAEELGFGSAEAMYIQLQNWGWPEWAVYKDLPQQPRAARRAQNTSEAIRLPPANRASELFKEALEDLTQAVEQQSEREEYLQSERFVAFDRWTNPEFEEERSRLNELAASQSEGFFLSVTRERSQLLGGTSYPPEPLPTLVAVYALMGKPLRPLIEALHPAPSQADLREAEERVIGKKGLQDRARQLATLIRGGDVRKGRPPGELTPQEHGAAFWIDLYVRLGHSDEQIQEKLRSYGYHLSVEEIARIRNLRPNVP